MRVDFLTPNEGRDTDVLQRLPAFQTDAEPLRFLDFLINDPEPAAILHAAGIYVLVPAPNRYAIHKLIVSRRRPEGAAKRDKDISQAAALLPILSEKRPYELKEIWLEASNRGKTWRQLLVEGLGQLPAMTRDITLRAVGEQRDIIPRIDLTFSNSAPRYDFERDIVTFTGEALRSEVRCAVSRETLADHFGANNLSEEGRIEKFRQNRSTIEQMAREKYLHWPVEQPDFVLIKTMDVPKIQEVIGKQARVT